ncbi:hypothetical protein HGRIS_002080 [Hohenbuehelia grisea]|uniref:RNA-dependent RNA polymerase n=1 Tax=Hohenbuehelia grisea TaxID=104357 RepID=A0ABR3JK27_9AGAR
MDVAIQQIPRTASEWDVARAIAAVLHSDEFKRGEANGRDLNFKVKLNPSVIGGVRNDGSGRVTIPNSDVVQRFLTWVKDTPIRLDKQKLKFYVPKSSRPPPWLVSQLDRTYFTNPDIDEEREQILQSLDDSLRVDAVQFGTYYRSSWPSRDEEPLGLRSYSIEWERDLVNQSVGWLRFNYDHKLLTLRLGDQARDQYGHIVSISFSSINKIAIGWDGKPYLCFDTITPPIFEREQLHRSLTGDDKKDSERFRHRVDSLHPGHKAVAPYAHQLRVLLYDSRDMLDRFQTLCQRAGLDCKKLVVEIKHPWRLDACRQGFFTSKRLHQVRAWVASLPWDVAFQVEALLHNFILNTDDIMVAIYSPINKLVAEHPDHAGHFLRQYSEALQNRPPRESPLACFNRVLQSWSPRIPRLSSGNFQCCHVTFTPTRLILEGPYPLQSNRVIRQYQGYEGNFIRVDFRDEDRLNYSWNREVDGTTFVRHRVGGTLKNGFELGGRYFEFLAYSQSALREHAVWFMRRFEHPIKGMVTPDTIRGSLGIFDHPGKRLLHQPSKYAARIAQAFTATDPSVKITRKEWRKVPDLCPNPSRDNPEPAAFTDGCGTIAKSLGDRIWEAQCQDRRDNGRNSIQPSVFQIRFLGFKGVVSVDEHMDRRKDGVKMLLRESMFKFEHEDVDEAEIEIALAFEKPSLAYLNRPLIMLLEHRGIRKEAFLELQRQAVAEALMVHDSFQKFQELLDSHRLGWGYRLPTIITRLRGLGLDMHPGGGIQFDNAFMRELRRVAMTSVLRDVKHDARILIPKSYLLVGVADEGPAYVKAGRKNVYCLKEGYIYACIQKPGDLKPTWLKGTCTICRSPVIHPGDVQRVIAIGEPPADMFCTFRNLKNAVVFPSMGKRALPSCLGGGDLDGDQYAVIQHHPLLPTGVQAAAIYPAIQPREAKEHIDCEFDESSGPDAPCIKEEHWSRVHINTKPPCDARAIQCQLDQHWETVHLDCEDEDGAEPDESQCVVPSHLRTRDCTIEDICDFVVEYITSDVLGLIADRHLVISDQSNVGLETVLSLFL